MTDCKSKLCLINSKFLGSKVVDRGTSDIELGCLLHSIGTKKWPKWRKRTPVTLGFVQKSFVITFNHHGEKTRVCDLRDVSKVSVHPTQERVVGLVLNDRQSHTRRFLCFKLSRKANMKGHQFKKLHQIKLQLHHPTPKVKSVRKVQHPHNHKTVCATEARLQAAKAAVASSRPPLSSTTVTNTVTRPSLQQSKERRRHKYGYYINGKLIGVGYRPSVTRAQCHTYEPVTGRSFPTYENLVQYQQQHFLQFSHFTSVHA